MNKKELAEIIKRVELSILLTMVVFAAHELSGFLEQMVVEGIKVAWVYLFLWYAGFTFLFLSFYQNYWRRN